MRGHDLVRLTAVVAVLACYATIILGGNVMASDAGLGCPDWPACHGSFLPPLAGATGIEWAHRLSAIVLSVLVTALAAVALLYERGRPVVLRLAGASVALVVGQALLGGLVVDSGLQVGLVLLHLGLATALFGLLLLVALLTNLREIPRRWRAWIERAADELPPSAQLARRSPDGTPGAPGPAATTAPPP